MGKGKRKGGGVRSFVDRLLTTREGIVVAVAKPRERWSLLSSKGGSRMFSVVVRAFERGSREGGGRGSGGKGSSS